MAKKIKLKIFLIIFIGNFSAFCESKSLGLDNADYSTKSYIEEDKQHQVPETTTDYPKTTSSSQSLDDLSHFQSIASFWNEKKANALTEETTQHLDDKESLDIQTTTTTSELDLGGDNFSTNEIKINSFEDATSIEKKFHEDDNNQPRNNSTKEERKFLVESIVNEETTKYYQTRNTVKIDDFNSDEAENLEEKPRTLPSVSTPKINSTTKKGKNLDLLHSESIPNNAEVWSLVGMMKDVAQTTGSQRKKDDRSLSEKQEPMHADVKNLFDWTGIARMSDLQLAQSNETEDLSVTTTEPSDVTTNGNIQYDKTLTTTLLPTNFDKDESTTTVVTENSHFDTKTTTWTSEEAVTTTEKSTEVKTHLSEITEHSNEDIITISSALSRTTEETKLIQTTSERVRSTSASESTTVKSTTKEQTSSISTLSTAHLSDGYLTASSEPVFRITPAYDNTFYTENDKDKYNAVHEFQITTDSSEITTRKQNFNEENSETSSGSLGVISAVISVVVLLSLIAIVYFIIKKRREKQINQRCRPVPVGLDAYSLDNVSVFNSIRRKANAIRASKRSYDNSAFEDPTLRSNVLDIQALKEFVKKKKSIEDEFKNIPTVSARIEDIPENVEDKNRFANVLPLSQTRVMLKRIDDDEKTEYINANYVTGPKDTTRYYIATQGPLESTIPDFWRMMWEQNSRVILMLTDFHENGIEKCAQYIPSSVILDNSQTFGDFEVTLKNREVKGKYAVSKIHLKNLQTKTWREITHFWYSWPTDRGCPSDEMSVINLLLEARTFLSKTTAADNLDENSNMDGKEKISTLDKTKSLQKVQGPLTVHCNNGVGRTGAIIGCDTVLRYLEQHRQIDIPQIVYKIRRDRANSIRTKDQYEFIYNIANAYAATLTTGNET